MSLDMTVLRLLRHKDRYDRMARAVPHRALDQRTSVILADFGRFFKETGTEVIDSSPFTTWFKLAHPKLRDEDLSIYAALFKQFDVAVEPGIEVGIMERLVAADAAAQMSELLQKWNDGEEVDLYAGMRAGVDRYEEQRLRRSEDWQELTPIEDMLAELENDVGLHWRLPCLNRHMRPLVGGDFLIVAGRPDKGKTTFCADQLTHMAAQVDKLYPGEKRSILWFNNEGPSKRIVERCFQASLGATFEELYKLSAQPATEEPERFRTLLRQRYAAALGGRPGVLRVLSAHGRTSYEVEEQIKRHRPALILFDMVDNIQFGGTVSNNGQRTDQLLEAMYQWARLVGVKYDTGVIATSQLSADADGQQWPTLPQLKDSKTGKQGAADVIITIGSVNDPSLVNSRYIGTTKNKKVRTGVPASPMCEVVYDGGRARYVEVQ